MIICSFMYRIQCDPFYLIIGNTSAAAAIADNWEDIELSEGMLASDLVEDDVYRYSVDVEDKIERWNEKNIDYDFMAKVVMVCSSSILSSSSSIVSSTIEIEKVVTLISNICYLFRLCS